MNQGIIIATLICFVSQTHADNFKVVYKQRKLQHDFPTTEIWIHVKQQLTSKKQAFICSKQVVKTSFLLFVPILTAFMSHSIIDLRYGFQSSYLRVLCMNKHITLQIIGKQYKYHMILHWYPWIIQINTSFLAYYLIYFNFNIIYLLHFVIYVYVCVYVNKYITQVRNDIFIDSKSKVQEETGSFSREMQIQP